MMDDPDIFTINVPAPTANRPLLGLTVLVVEDSRFASEALRLLCLRSGARIRRADCLRAARRHLQVYRPTVVLVDIGLRDGDGAGLIAEMAAAQPRIPAILGMSGNPGLEQVALNAGADAFLAKPITSLGAFQEAILAHLPDDRQPAGPRAIPSEEVHPDRIAYRDDLAQMADLLAMSDDDTVMDYVAQFLGGVADSAEDHTLARAARALAEKRANGAPTSSELARIAGMVQQRLDNKLAL